MDREKASWNLRLVVVSTREFRPLAGQGCFAITFLGHALAALQLIILSCFTVPPETILFLVLSLTCKYSEELRLCICRKCGILSGVRVLPRPHRRRESLSLINPFFQTTSRLLIFSLRFILSHYHRNGTTTSYFCESILRYLA